MQADGQIIQKEVVLAIVKIEGVQELAVPVEVVAVQIGLDQAVVLRRARPRPHPLDQCLAAPPLPVQARRQTLKIQHGFGVPMPTAGQVWVWEIALGQHMQLSR